jgi:hypothetical protein
MDRGRATCGGQKPTAPTTRLLSEYSRIDTYYATRLGPRCTMGRAEVLEASLHLGTGPGAGTRVVLKVPPDRQQPQRPKYSNLVGSSRIAF